MEGVSQDSFIPAKKSFDGIEWEEPYPGALEDLPPSHEKVFFNSGTFHTSIIKSAARFEKKHFPAFLDMITNR